MYGNPYYNQTQQRYQPTIPQQPIQTSNYIQPVVPNVMQQVGLLGKPVESIDVVKAMDIPLDGSISYFPLSDGTAIVSKQLQTDGTSKITVYKPTNDSKEETIKFATFEDIQEAINDIDLSDIQDLKDEIKDIKKQLKEFKIKKGREE